MTSAESPRPNASPDGLYDYSVFAKQPGISFIIPSFNQGIYLETCLESILNQGYMQAELLVSDGGSTDESKAILHEYAPRLAYARSSSDKGTWDANNQALALATGEYVWVVNSDDGLVEGAIYRFLEALNQQPEQKWFTGKVLAVDAGGRERAVFSPQRQVETAGNSFLTECWIYHPATILHRELALPYAETDLLDWDLWIRLEKLGYIPNLIDSPLAFLRFHDACKSFDSLGILQKQIELLKYQERVYTSGDIDKVKDDYARLLHTKQVAIEQARIKTAAYDGDKGKALRLSFELALTRPEALGQRWFWGLVRRIFTGFSLAEVSPLAFLEEERP